MTSQYEEEALEEEMSFESIKGEHLSLKRLAQAWESGELNHLDTDQVKALIESARDRALQATIVR